MADNMFCPICGNKHISHYSANKPVADFHCAHCNADYELKSKENPHGTIGNKIADGAYHTMIERITSSSNPHLFVMTYSENRVCNLILIPNYFFTPSIIEKRRPLAPTARRAGWTGCNIEIGKIPAFGRIPIIQDGTPNEISHITKAYSKTSCLRQSDIESRGWLMDVLRCIGNIASDEFSLKDIYGFTSQLQALHPQNKSIEAKIRQQLQFLRDKGYVQFVSPGHYRKLHG